MAIRPDILLQQVKSTAGWAFENSSAPYIVALGYSPNTEANDDWSRSPEYFRMLLAAHHTTVATHSPTDVDNRIRFHAWQAAETIDELRALNAEAKAFRSWSLPEVTNFYLDVGGDRIAGHDGEHLSVDAGALARAIQLGDKQTEEEVLERIVGDLNRHARVFNALRGQRDQEQKVLNASFLLAHAGGDLTRVVEDWPVKTERAKQWRALLAKPEESSEPWGKAFALAGKLNREIMAKEHHRFLPLREPKALRRSRRFLRSFGPCLEPLGEAIAQSKMLDETDLAEVLAGFLHGVESTPDCDSYVRAIVGMNRQLRGGIDALEDGLPARLRKVLRKGVWRQHLDLDDQRFRQRLIGKYKRVMGG